MEQINHPTHIPENHAHSPDKLNLFITFKPLHYGYTVSPPAGLFDHTHINILLTTTLPSAVPSTCQYWHFNSANWTNSGNFFFDFLWEDYRLSSDDASIPSERIVEVVVPEMEAYIPPSSGTFSSFNLWSNRSCSEANR